MVFASGECYLATSYIAKSIGTPLQRELWCVAVFQGLDLDPFVPVEGTKKVYYILQINNEM